MKVSRRLESDLLARLCREPELAQGPDSSGPPELACRRVAELWEAALLVAELSAVALLEAES